MEIEMGVIQPQTKGTERLGLQKLEEARKDSSARLGREHNPAGTLTLAFGPPALRIILS